MAFFSQDMEQILAMGEEEFREHFRYTEVIEINEEVTQTLTYSGLIVQSGLRKTRGDAKRVIKQNGLQINGEAVKEDRLIDLNSDLLHGKYLIMKVGKKNFALIALNK